MGICKKVLKILTLTITLFFSVSLILEAENKIFQTGKASYYSYELNQRKTASGEHFNPKSLIAAHKTLPIGTKIKVTNLSNNKSVIVRVADRGPFVKNRIIDLSFGAAKKIGMLKSGTVKVTIEVINNDNNIKKS